jgi:hypothetical protein
MRVFSAIGMICKIDPVLLRLPLWLKRFVAGAM